MVLLKGIERASKDLAYPQVYKLACEIDTEANEMEQTTACLGQPVC